MPNRPFASAALAVCAVSLGCAPRATAQTYNWDQPGLNAAHTAYNNAETTITKRGLRKLKQTWMLSTGNSIVAPPIEVSGIAYALSTDGHLYAVDATTGAAVWTYTTGPNNDNTAALGVTSDGKRIYTTCKIDSDGGHLGGHYGICAVNAKTGAQLWTYGIYHDGNGVPTDCLPLNPPIVEGGRVFFGMQTVTSDANGYVAAGTFAVNPATGVLDYGIANNPADTKLPLAADRGLVFVFNSANGSGYYKPCAYSQADGSQQWCAAGQYNATSPAATAAGGKMLFESIAPDGNSAALNALDETTGAIVWQQTVAGGSALNSSAPAVAKGLVYFSLLHASEDLYAVSLKTGATIWVSPGVGGGSGGLISTPSVANGVVYARCKGAKDQCAFNAKTGAVLLSTGGSFNNGPSPSGAPLVANGAEITICGASNLCRFAP